MANLLPRHTPDQYPLDITFKREDRGRQPKEWIGAHNTDSLTSLCIDCQ